MFDVVAAREPTHLLEPGFSFAHATPSLSSNLSHGEFSQKLTNKETSLDVQSSKFSTIRDASLICMSRDQMKPKAFSEATSLSTETRKITTARSGLHFGT
jgi:hypothetical protein